MLSRTAGVTTDVLAKSDPKAAAPAMFPKSTIAHSRNIRPSVSSDGRASTGITGSSVFSVKSWLRPMITRMKPSGYTAADTANLYSGPTSVAAYAPPTKLQPMVNPAVTADHNRSHAGRPISSLAASSTLSWISCADSRVPTSGPTGAFEAAEGAAPRREDRGFDVTMRPVQHGESEPRPPTRKKLASPAVEPYSRG